MREWVLILLAALSLAGLPLLGELTARLSRLPHPDLAQWRAVLERNRHHAPAGRITYIRRTPASLRRQAIEVYRPPVRPGRHSAEHLLADTGEHHGMARLMRRSG